MTTDKVFYEDGNSRVEMYFGCCWLEIERFSGRVDSANVHLNFESIVS